MSPQNHHFVAPYICEVVVATDSPKLLSPRSGRPRRPTVPEPGVRPRAMQMPNALQAYSAILDMDVHLRTEMYALISLVSGFFTRTARAAAGKCGELV